MYAASPESTLHRRLAAEWRLLQAMAAANTGRLEQLSTDDLTMNCTLLATPAKGVDGSPRSDHQIRITFPITFPAAPMEVALETPVRHPNIHPRTGFVCVWEAHRSTNTVEHALLKTEAMLSGCLWNDRDAHVMQPEVLAEYRIRRTEGGGTVGGEIRAEAAHSPLRSVTSYTAVAPGAAVLRRRLS